jgi:steroid delta-isomerase-like uncharacterized protein
MTPGENKAVVARIVDMFNGKGFDALGECLAENLVLHSDLVPEPVGGIDDLRQLFATVKGGFPGARITVQELTADEDRVALRFVFNGTHLGEIKGNAPTGRTVSWQEAMFFRFGAAKAEEIWHMLNVMEVLEKLGALPSEKVRERIQQARTLLGKLGRVARGGR